MPETDFTKVFPYCNQWGFRKVDVCSLEYPTDALEDDGWQTLYTSPGCAETREIMTSPAWMNQWPDQTIDRTVLECGCILGYVQREGHSCAELKGYDAFTKDPTDWEPEK